MTLIGEEMKQRMRDVWKGEGDEAGRRGRKGDEEAGNHPSSLPAGFLECRTTPH